MTLVRPSALRQYGCRCALFKAVSSSDITSGTGRGEYVLQARRNARVSWNAVGCAGPQGSTGATARPWNGRRHSEGGFFATTIDAIASQQQRILHRAALLEYGLTAGRRNGVVLPVGEALSELLTDSSDAARTIGTILPPVRR